MFRALKIISTAEHPLSCLAAGSLPGESCQGQVLAGVGAPDTACWPAPLPSGVKTPFRKTRFPEWVEPVPGAVQLVCSMGAAPRVQPLPHGPSRAVGNCTFSPATSFLPKKMFLQIECHLISFKMTSNHTVSSILSLITLRARLRCTFGGLGLREEPHRVHHAGASV